MRRPNPIPVLLSVAAAGVVALFFEAATPAQTRAPVVRYEVVPERSEARYRVREQLVSLNFPNDAVGVTHAIAGGLAFDAEGRILTGDSRFTVDLRTLRSDEARRDNYLRRNTLETDRYPTATLVPLEIRGVPVPLPPTGTLPVQLVGDLTIRDVTRRLTWEATATFENAGARVQARTAFRFGDFGLRVPRVAVVLSVEDHIRLETDLVLRRSS